VSTDLIATPAQRSGVCSDGRMFFISSTALAITAVLPAMR